MTDVALLYQKILKSVSKFENGNSSRLMSKMGLNYKKNSGVSIPEIDKLAQNYRKNNQLAVFLLNQDEREVKLLAMRLFDYDLQPETFLEDVLNSINNAEMAEQAAMHYFVNLSDFNKIAQKLISHGNEYCRLSAYLAIARYARFSKSASDRWFEELLVSYGLSEYSDETPPLKRAQSAMLSAISLRSEDLRRKVHNCIQNKRFRTEELKRFYIEELESFFYN
ncbi:MAG: DNA alkylation repair protein [Bacteroidales bacterium]